MPALDSSKTLHGTITVDILASSTSKASFAGLLKESFSLNVTPVFEELGDHTKDIWGHEIDLVITIPEVDPTTMNLIEEGDNVSIDFSAKNKTLDMDANQVKNIYCEVADKKCKIHVKALEVGVNNSTDWSEIFDLS